MALNVDTAHALRTTAELTSLVRAIREAPVAEPETDSLEWKSDWDITQAERRFESARHILGFGNRTVFAAEQTFEGCAYLVAGVEPGNLVGVPETDPADIDNQLSKYILPSQPRWTPSYVRIDDKSVLVFTIEAPRAGDPIFVLQKGFNNAPPGRIYVRRHGKTEEAGPADVRALETRGQAVRPRVELTVTRADEPADFRAARFTDEDLQEWLASERQRLALPAEPKRQPHDYLRSFPSPTSYLNGEARSRDGYAEEVHSYLRRARERWFARLAAATVQQRLAPIELQIVNPTERNFEGVEVTIDLADEQMAWMSVDDVDETLNPPKPPKPWGTQRFTDTFTDVYVPSASFAVDEIERVGPTRRVRFMSRHLRPGQTVNLAPIYLTLPPAAAGQTVTVAWRLTSSGVDGWQEGEIDFAVAHTALPVTAPND